MKTSLKFLLFLFGLNMALFSCSAEPINDDTDTELLATNPPNQNLNPPAEPED